MIPEGKAVTDIMPNVMIDHYELRKTDASFGLDC